VRDFDKAFGLAVRQKRLELKLSQEELAFQSKLHRTYISQIERGIKSPSLRENRKKIHRIMSITHH